jgi:hypothetical protein
LGAQVQLPADLGALETASGEVSPEMCNNTPLFLSRLWVLLCCLMLKEFIFKVRASPTK